MEGSSKEQTKRATVSGSNSIKCSGAPPHQSLSAWRLCRILQRWVVEKHRRVDGLLSTKLSSPRDVGPRQANAWLYFLTTNPLTHCKQTLLHPAPLRGLAWLFEWRTLRSSTYSRPLLEDLQATECEGNKVASVGPGPHQSKSRIPSRLNQRTKPVWQALTQCIKVDLLINSGKHSFFPFFPPWQE